MLPARPRSVARLVSWSAPLALVLAGCGDSSAPAPAPAPAAAPTAADAPSPDAGAKAPAKPSAEAKAVEPATAGTPAGEDWLVWFSRDGQWVTRWIDTAAREPTVVAERGALVLSDGARLWRVERHDADVGVLPCECQDGERPPGEDCKPESRLTVPGLRAVELGAGTTIAIRPPATGEVHGDGIEESVEPAGGAGARLIYDWSESGYMCGAHGLYAGDTVVFDLAAAKPVEEPFSAVGRALPLEVREGAAKEIHEHLRECDLSDAPTLAQVLDERMQLRGVHVVLTGGTPRLEWSFAADTPYVCSPDYSAWGSGQSGLVPAAGPLGLDELPPGVAHALSSIGDAPAVGWSRLSLSGPARTAALEAFRGVPEAKWPPAFTSMRPIGAEAPGTRQQARAKLDEGRRLTRSAEYDQAIARFDEAIALDPKLARAWSERGYAKLLAGDLTGARADLEAALPLDEGAAYRAAVHYNLGLLAERSGDPGAARAAYEASLALRDNETVRKALTGLR